MSDLERADWHDLDRQNKELRRLLAAEQNELVKRAEERDSALSPAAGEDETR